MEEWTKEPPTEPGYYWLRMEGASGYDAIRRLDWIPGFEGERLFIAGVDPKRSEAELGLGWWAGPIPEPKEQP